jgi:hypothetical protein
MNWEIGANLNKSRLIDEMRLSFAFTFPIWRERIRYFNFHFVFVKCVLHSNAKCGCKFIWHGLQKVKLHLLILI